MVAVAALITYDPNTGLFTRHFKKGDRVVEPCLKGGYCRIGYEGRMWQAHRLAFKLMGEPLPDSLDVDHINGIRTDNRWCNLRLSTPQQNQLNLGGARGSNISTGVLGVSYDPERRGRKHYHSRLCVGGKPVLNAHFATLEEAESAYMAARKAHADPIMINTRL